MAHAIIIGQQPIVWIKYQLQSLQIYDGSTDSSAILAQLCGSSLPGTITSTKNQLLIKFTTNDIITAPGFSAQVNFVKGKW